MLNKISPIKTAISVLLLATLASCGGSSSTSGGQTDFSVVPGEIELTFADGNTTCYVSPGSDYTQTVVTVVGGTPPYQIVNSAPQYVATSVTELETDNASFTVYSLGGCGEFNILVLDNLSRSVSFQITHTPGDDADE